MQIRADQLEQMDQARKDESFRRLVADLRQSAPQATSHLTDEALLTIIEQAVENAHGYGVQSSEATTAFVKIAVFAGISFDKDPAVQNYLRTPELDPDYKVILLAELASKKMKDNLR